MSEARLGTQAEKRIDDFTLGLARQSHAPYAKAEEARRELASHVAELAIEVARRRGQAEVGAAEVNEAIRELGPLPGVRDAFFGHEEPQLRRRIAWPELLLVSLAILVAGTAAHAVWTLGYEFSFGLHWLHDNWEWVPLWALAGIGAATTYAVWSRRGRLALVLAGILVISASTLFMQLKDHDWLRFLTPAFFALLGAGFGKEFRSFRERLNGIAPIRGS